MDRCSRHMYGQNTERVRSYKEVNFLNDSQLSIHALMEVSEHLSVPGSVPGPKGAVGNQRNEFPAFKGLWSSGNKDKRKMRL